MATNLKIKLTLKDKIDIFFDSGILQVFLYKRKVNTQYFICTPNRTKQSMESSQ